MFKQKYFRSKFPQKSYKESTLFPVLTAEKLLGTPKQKQHIHKMYQQVKAPNQTVTDLYTALLNNFAEFVQLIPFRYGGKLGSLLDYGFRMALFALDIRYEKQIKMVDHAFTYALFSAALTRNLGKVFLDRKIILSDDKGRFIKDWLPFEGNMSIYAEHYKMRRYFSCPPELEILANSLLVRQVVPENAFNWIASDHDLLLMWLAVIAGDDERGDELADILQLAKLKLEETLQEGYEPSIIEVDLVEPEEVALGEDFIEWLRERLEDGTITINKEDSPIQVVDEGIFIDYPGVFQDYANFYEKHRDWVVVYQQFNMLGLTKLSGYDYKNEQYFAKAPGFSLANIVEAQQTQLFTKKAKGKSWLPKQGALIGDKGWLFSKNKTPANNGQVKLNSPDWHQKQSLPKEIPPKMPEVVMPKPSQKPF